MIFGLISALAWGGSDFTAGAVSRRMGAYRTGFYGEVTGLVLLLGLVAILGEPVPGLEAWGWGIAAGAVGGAGLLIFYIALASGPMSIAAPVAGLTGVVLPILASLFTESLLAPTTYAGFGLALVAIWLISREEGTQKKIHLRLADLRLALISGVCFGIYFILIHQGTREATLWPMIASRSAGAVVMGCIALYKRQISLPPRSFWPLVLLNGTLDIGGNGFYILAAQAGRLDMAAVISSLYPAVTVLLAWSILKERIGKVQIIGVLVALVAIVMMTI